MNKYIYIYVYICTHTFRYYSFIDVLFSASVRMCGCVLLHEQYLQIAVYSFPGIERRNMYTCCDRFLIFNAATDGFYYYA